MCVYLFSIANTQKSHYMPIYSFYCDFKKTQERQKKKNNVKINASASIQWERERARPFLINVVSISCGYCVYSEDIFEAEYQNFQCLSFFLSINFGTLFFRRKENELFFVCVLSIIAEKSI